MFGGLVLWIAGGVADVLALLGYDRLEERLERRNRPDPRNFPPPR